MPLSNKNIGNIVKQQICQEKLQVQSSANKEQQEELKRQSGSIRRLKENEADLKEALTVSYHIAINLFYKQHY